MVLSLWPIRNSSTTYRRGRLHIDELSVEELIIDKASFVRELDDSTNSQRVKAKTARQETYAKLKALETFTLLIATYDITYTHPDKAVRTCVEIAVHPAVVDNDTTLPENISRVPTCVPKTALCFVKFVQHAGQWFQLEDKRHDKAAGMQWEKGKVCGVSPTYK